MKIEIGRVTMTRSNEKKMTTRSQNRVLGDPPSAGTKTSSPCDSPPLAGNFLEDCGMMAQICCRPLRVHIFWSKVASIFFSGGSGDPMQSNYVVICEAYCVFSLLCSNNSSLGLRKLLENSYSS